MSNDTLRFTRWNACQERIDVENVFQIFDTNRRTTYADGTNKLHFNCIRYKCRIYFFEINPPGTATLIVKKLADTFID